MDEHRTAIVVGAGLAGLMTARVLQRGGVDVTVLEADAALGARSQGGMLDIHEDTGQVALATAGLLEDLQPLVLPGGEARRVLDRHATVRLSSDGPGGRPEVPRPALRRLLVESLADGTVRWGSKVISVSTGDDGRHRARTADGTSLSADLLVGADGTWSRVRPLLTTTAPAYTGVTAVEGRLSDADARHPGAAAAMGSGNLFALAEGLAVLGHREPGAELSFWATMAVPEQWAHDAAALSQAALRTDLLARYAGWHADLRAFIAATDADLVVRPLHALPTGTRWDRLPGATLVGDAAHVMSFFAGEGANAALADGAELAQAVLAHPGDLDAALDDYEPAMWRRSAQAAALSADNLDVVMHDAAAPQRFVDLLQEFEHAA